MPGKNTRITTHGPYGHEYTPENCAIVPSGGKRCLECRRMAKEGGQLPPTMPRERRKATHCRYGHEYTPDNTYTNPKSGARDCRTCRKLSQTKWKKENPERMSELERKSVLNRKYGLSLEEYDEMLKAQNGRCAICERLPKEGQLLHVDHCHRSDKVRALLCFKCNSGLGCYYDNPELLMKAARYLQEFQ
jgi:hypothetical protein